MAKVKIQLVGTWKAWSQRVRDGRLIRPDGSSERVLIRTIPEIAAAGPEVQSLRRDGRLLARIQHEHVLRLLHVSVAGQDVVAVHEGFEGASLARILDALRDRGQYLPLKAAIDVAAGVAHAVDAVEAAGRAADDASVRYLHPGPTPSDVLLDASGQVKVAGFSVCRPDGVELKPPAGYAPPEGSPSAGQAAYGLGALLVELLTGERPAGGSSDANRHEAMIRRALIKVLARPGEAVPDGLVNLVRQCLARDPEARPAAEAIAERLEELGSTLKGAGVRAWAPGVVPAVIDLYRRQAATAKQKPASPQAHPSSPSTRSARQVMPPTITGIHERKRMQSPTAPPEREPPRSAGPQAGAGEASSEPPPRRSVVTRPPLERLLPQPTDEARAAALRRAAAVRATDAARQREAERRSADRARQAPKAPPAAAVGERGLPEADDAYESEPTRIAPVSELRRASGDRARASTSAAGGASADDRNLFRLETQETPSRAGDISPAAEAGGVVDEDDADLYVPGRQSRMGKLVLALFVLCSVGGLGYLSWKVLAKTMETAGTSGAAAEAGPSSTKRAGPAHETSPTPDVSAEEIDQPSAPAPKQSTASSEQSPRGASARGGASTASTRQPAQVAGPSAATLSAGHARSKPSEPAAHGRAGTSASRSGSTAKTGATPAASSRTAGAGTSSTTRTADGREVATFGIDQSKPTGTTPASGKPAAPEPLQVVQTAAPSTFEVKFQAGEGVVLDVKCHQGRGEGAGTVVIPDAGKGPCRVEGRVGEERLVTVVALSGPRTFTCFANGERNCH